ncbi:hypothetical protein ACYSNO_06000 [Enterococcus sp. LJL98]
MVKKILIGLAGLIFLVFVLNYFNQASEISNQINQKPGQVEIKGKITNEEDVLAVYALLEKNLQAANEEDLETYLSTLVPEAREATKKEMVPFFETYDVKHTLVSFEVIKEDGERILVKARQKTVNEGTEKYRNHITEANHTFVKIDGEWLLEETAMSDTQFF